MFHLSALALALAAGSLAVPPAATQTRPAQNDLNLQMRKPGIDEVILAVTSANLCTQAHLYELLELGYEAAVVRDATAGAKVPEGHGYLAAIIKFRMVANGVWWTDDAVKRIAAGS